MMTIRDMKTLFRAQQIADHLAPTTPAGRLAPIIALARKRLEAQKGRRRYVKEMLPPPVAHGIPGVSGDFGVVLADDRCVVLEENNMPVVTQIAALEQRWRLPVVKVIHRNGGIQEYYL